MTKHKHARKLILPNTTNIIDCALDAVSFTTITKKYSMYRNPSLYPTGTKATVSDADVTYVLPYPMPVP